MILELEKCKCDICGSAEYTVVWDKHKRERLGKLHGTVIRDDEQNIIHGKNVMCNKCGLVYVNPRMTRKTLSQFYENEYRKVYGESVEINVERNHAINTVKILGEYIDKPCKTLDIGASTGQLVDLLKMNEFDSLGIEAGERNANIAIENGINVKNINFDNWITDEKFDIVTMLNTLEHVYSPTETLTKIHNIINNEGYLLISVPDLLNINIKRTTDVYLSNAHIYNFTHKTIKYLLNKVGFEVLNMYSINEEIGNKLYVVSKKLEPVEVEYKSSNPNKMIKFLNYLDKAIKLREGL